MCFAFELLRRKGTEVHTIRRSDTVFEAIGVMAGNGIGSLVVVDGSAVCGIITERDYLRKVALKGRSSRTTTVGEIMTAPVQTASPADTIETCMQIMTDQRCRHLPIVEDGRLVGIISIGDIVKQMLHEKEAEVGQLQDYIQGKYPG